MVSALTTARDGERLVRDIAAVLHARYGNSEGKCKALTLLEETLHPMRVEAVITSNFVVHELHVHDCTDMNCKGCNPSTAYRLEAS